MVVDGSKTVFRCASLLDTWITGIMVTVPPHSPGLLSLCMSLDVHASISQTVQFEYWLPPSQESLPFVEDKPKTEELQRLAFLIFSKSKCLDIASSKVSPSGQKDGKFFFFFFLHKQIMSRIGPEMHCFVVDVSLLSKIGFRSLQLGEYENQNEGVVDDGVNLAAVRSSCKPRCRLKQVEQQRRPPPLSGVSCSVTFAVALGGQGRLLPGW
ncbi:hypothetical protein MLD38_024359 [Melastoma candidum]|uniref:Uncharacterized protein n=1 Tax=Melastoma candidum TaxID=119954 RepID=A0ACB9NSZ3_9MYRT|nr:hypothetical protein MLD38_024359 [Melastoma candidum]